MFSAHASSIVQYLARRSVGRDPSINVAKNLKYLCRDLLLIPEDQYQKYDQAQPFTAMKPISITVQEVVISGIQWLLYMRLTLHASQRH